MTDTTFHTPPHSVCSLCKGQCCQSLPGIYHPDDIERMYNEKISVELLVKVFQTGLVAIDWWESDPRYEFDPDRERHPGELEEAMYLRPKGIKARHKLKDPSYRNNPCIHWNKDTGCELPNENKPYGCRTLVPSQSAWPYGCDYTKKHDGSKQAMSIAWIPYQDMIEGAIKIYEATHEAS